MPLKAYKSLFLRARQLMQSLTVGFAWLLYTFLEHLLLLVRTASFYLRPMELALFNKLTRNATLQNSLQNLLTNSP